MNELCTGRNVTEPLASNLARRFGLALARRGPAQLVDG